MHPYNRAWGAVFPLKKELYKGEDIKVVEEAVNELLEQFYKEGIYVYVHGRSGQMVRGIEIDFKTVDTYNSYVDMETIQLNLIT